MAEKVEIATVKLVQAEEMIKVSSTFLLIHDSESWTGNFTSIYRMTAILKIVES